MISFAEIFAAAPATANRDAALLSFPGGTGKWQDPFADRRKAGSRLGQSSEFAATFSGRTPYRLCLSGWTISGCTAHAGATELGLDISKRFKNFRH